MSTTLPYLQKLRKSDLVEHAETSKLANYAGLKKSELETVLDEHLRANSTTYSKEPSLADYYKRLDKPKSPVRKVVEKVSEMVKSDDDAPAPAPAKKSRRKTKSPDDEADAEATTTALVKTPAKEVVKRSSAYVSQISPPSPAVVADAIDHQTRRIRASISHAYERSKITEYIDQARERLSSAAALNIITILVEFACLQADILPKKILYEVPSIKYLTKRAIPIHASDLFLLLTGKFWAPFLLWLLATIVAPAIISYFINLPLKASPGHNYATRRATIKHEPHRQFDPFIFNIAKGLLGYLIFAQHLQLGIFAHFTKSAVNNSLPGGYKGILTSSGITAAVALYEAVLKK